MTDPAHVQSLLLQVTTAALSVLIFLALLRGVLGPRFTDRVIASNMVNTEIVVLIAALALTPGEEYWADVCLIYAAVSFLAVVVLMRSAIHEKREGDEQ